MQYVISFGNDADHFYRILWKQHVLEKGKWSLVLLRSLLRCVFFKRSLKFHWRTTIYSFHAILSAIGSIWITHHGVYRDVESTCNKWWFLSRIGLLRHCNKVIIEYWMKKKTLEAWSTVEYLSENMTAELMNFLQQNK